MTANSKQERITMEKDMTHIKELTKTMKNVRMVSPLGKLETRSSQT
jgi:hypothetical protein